jgi:Kef-type K+ transport system membrane component KefB
VEWVLATASGAERVVVDGFVVLAAAKLGDEAAKRTRPPVLIGEVLAGVLIGPPVLGAELVRRRSGP